MACLKLSADRCVELETRYCREVANASWARDRTLVRAFEKIAGMRRWTGIAAAEVLLVAGVEVMAKVRTGRDDSSWLETSGPCR